MSVTSKSITSETNTTLFRKYDKHKDLIKGLIEIGGSFNGGKLSFFISLTDGDTINPWLFETGEHFIAEAPTTREFIIPVRTMPTGGFVSIYYSFKSATPDITITIGDNT